MKKVEKELEYLIKNLNGKVLGIGLSKAAEMSIKKNKNITYCDLLNSSMKKTKDNGKKEKLFYLKNLRKKYKKNKLDTLIINYEEVQKYKKTFIKDSVHICSGYVYIFNEFNDDSKYERYNAKIEKTEIVKIDVSNSKTSYIKDMYFNILDTGEILIDYVSDFLSM